MGAVRAIKAFTLLEIAARIGAELRGDGSRRVWGVGAIDTATGEELTFLANPKYRHHLATTKAAAVIAGQGTEVGPGVALLECADPYLAFREAMVMLYGFRQHHPLVPSAGSGGESDAGAGFARANPRATEISSRASVHSSAVIGDGCIIYPFAVVEAGASIGANCVIYPHAFVGRDCYLGASCVIYANVSLYEGCTLGDRVVIQSGTVIGCDGYGFATSGGAHARIPQVGSVSIESDVDIGSCCVISRAAIGETRIGEGTKIADLVAVGHGTTIGKHCLIVSLVGISGSVRIGNYVVIGGQTGITGHLKIGDGAQIAGKTAVVTDIPAGMKVAGIPGVDHDLAKRNAFAGLNLYELSKRVKQMERQLAQLLKNESPEQP